MQLAAAARLAKELMHKHGLLPKWRFAFDRAVVRFGCCNWRERKISLSAKLVEMNERAGGARHDLARNRSRINLASGRSRAEVAAHRPIDRRQWSAVLWRRSRDAAAQICGHLPHLPANHSSQSASSCVLRHCDRAFNPKHLFRWSKHSDVRQ